MPFQRSVLVLMVCCFMFAAPDRASGEWFADLYIGGAWTDDEKIDVKRPEKFSFEHSDIQIAYPSFLAIGL